MTQIHRAMFSPISIVIWASLFVTSSQAEAADSTDKSRTGFAVEEKPDSLVIKHDGKPVCEFVFRDEKILRPHFTRLYSPSGFQLTRNNPPIAGTDATDHETMHPGIWLAFGDLGGSDFWRNKGRIEHVRFTQASEVSKDRVTFATESRLLTPDGKPVCQLASQIDLGIRPEGYLLRWNATFSSNDADFAFGDQEEMGFGARVATVLTEKNGGTITNSHGKTTAKATWGQPATWCDYSKTIDGKSTGITLMTSPKNFRQCWWHNRDYGLIVANPFGRNAMKQGEKSSVVVKKGESLQIQFAACLHETAGYDASKAYQDYLQSTK